VIRRGGQRSSVSGLTSIFHRPCGVRHRLQVLCGTSPSLPSGPTVMIGPLASSA